MGLFSGTPWDIPPHCDRCGELDSACKCPPLPAPPRVLLAADKQTARLRIENRRRGKSVTVVSGLAADDNDLPELLSRLKTACGAGGTLKDETLEIQGEHLDRLRTLLAGIGYKVSG